jgi:uncharacterized protein YdcH (DUF465 family)
MSHVPRVSRRGRPADVVWSHYDFNGSRKNVTCKYCSKRFSSPVSITLIAHLSNQQYAKLYKTTLCQMASVDLRNQCVNVLNDKISVTKDKRHRHDEDEENQYDLMKKQKIAQSDEICNAMIAFVKEFQLPIEVFSSPSFVKLCQTIRELDHQSKQTKSLTLQDYYIPLLSHNLPSTYDNIHTGNSHSDSTTSERSEVQSVSSTYSVSEMEDDIYLEDILEEYFDELCKDLSC